MSKLRSLFGKRVRQLRRLKDMTQEELAEAVGISPEFISNLERGVNSPSFDTLEKLAEALDVAPVEFFIFNE
ncbi:MAG: helix-turn-helix transcriptional regulator [Anaerolineae bacterium]